MRSELRVRHYSRRTEKAYVQWARRFILFHGKRHPRDVGAEGVSAFLRALAEDQGVAAATQSQALNALVFLYRSVLGEPALELDRVPRARRPHRLPVVLTPGEVAAVLRQLEGTARLMAAGSDQGHRDDGDSVADRLLDKAHVEPLEHVALRGELADAVHALGEREHELARAQQAPEVVAPDAHGFLLWDREKELPQLEGFELEEPRSYLNGGRRAIRDVPEELEIYRIRWRDR